LNKLKNKKYTFLTLFTVIFILTTFTSCDVLEEILLQSDITQSENSVDNKVSVHFIDVGQGDSTLISFNNEENILIDGGDTSTQDALVQYLKDIGIKKFKYVVATHPHSDHIGGLDDVMNNFDVENIILPDVSHSTTAFERLLLAIEKNEVNVMIPELEDKFSVGDINFTVLNPIKENYDNLNNYSVVLKMDYKDLSFMFAGDAESPVENDILKQGFDIDVDVYKVSHHGSSTSSSAKFVEAMSPAIGVISSGKNNDYGHPHRETVAVLKKNSIASYRTDELGTIVFELEDTQIFYDGDVIFDKATAPNKQTLYVDENGKGLIKGNINREGKKIYHMPGGAYYNQTNAEKYFKTEEDAINDGFKKSEQ